MKKKEKQLLGLLAVAVVAYILTKKAAPAPYDPISPDPVPQIPETVPFDPSIGRTRRSFFKRKSFF